MKYVKRLYKLVICLFLISNFQTGFAANEQEVKIVGKGAEIFRRAIAYEQKGKIADAVAEYKLYLNKNKDVAPAYFFLGNLYWDSGYKDKALETFKQAEKACAT
jgi:tetratricopeptide (TPR) repeat protein